MDFKLGHYQQPARFGRRAQVTVYWNFGAPTGECVLSPLESSRRLKIAGYGSLKHRRNWSEAMAQVCDICGKGPRFGNNISHAHNVTRRRWNVNLQAVKALVNGAPKKIRVCTSCIKAGKIAKA